MEERNYFAPSKENILTHFLVLKFPKAQTLSVMRPGDPGDPCDDRF
jgi:hypothetical protein